MQISLNWLNTYLDRPVQADEAERVLTAAGFPIEDRQSLTLASGQTDVSLDAEVTSNRSDCLSHLGLARELAASSGRQLVGPAIELQEDADADATALTSVTLDEPALCPLYTARIIRNVTVGPSPAWLVDRLEAVGQRSVNNVVDVTNFVLLELAQPLHAFDLGTLAEQRIVVRRAAADEPFTAIDSSQHKLSDRMLVIADAKRPVAVAGVMGGLDTEVGSSTTDILLESAIFDPLCIRRTSRALKLASDSSYRFERGVDPRGVERASRRAVQLILELAGGQLAAGVVRQGADEPEPRAVSMRSQRCNSLLGVELTPDQQAGYLDRLGLNARIESDAIHCRIPTHRLDLHREVDLIEEVARIHGLNAIPSQSRIEIEARPVQPRVAARDHLGRVLSARGYHESITFSFLSPAHAQPFLSPDAQAVRLAGDQRRAEPVLRPALLPSLLISRKTNQDLGNADVKLYETAATWQEVEGQSRETRRLALLRDAHDPQLALRELRGTLEELLERLAGPEGVQALSIQHAEHSNFAPAARITRHDQPLGHLGLISDATRDLFDLKVPVAAVEMDIDPLLDLYPPQRQVGNLPRFPAIERDLSIIVPESTAWAQVQQTLVAVNPDKLEAVRFLDTYRGKPIAKTHKSVSFRLVFRDPAGTLRHEQVDPQVQSVVDALGDQLGAELRG